MVLDGHGGVRALDPGSHAVVGVGVSTMWESPQAVRPCDGLANGREARVAEWVSGLTDQERRGLLGRTVTQLLLGEEVLVVGEQREGWVRVVALEQACPSQDPRGYPGWLPVAHLVPHDLPGPAAEARLVVDALRTPLLERPSGRVVTEVVVGTRLVQATEAHGQHLPVWVPGRVEPVWVGRAAVAPVDAEPASAERILRLARRFVGVPYVWGGISPLGVDCSGLIYVAHRRFGASVPRDADDQARDCRPLCEDEAAVASEGLLAFFTGDDGQVDHVGLLDGPGRLLHASGSVGAVRSQPLDADLRSRLAAVGRAVA